MGLAFPFISLEREDLSVTMEQITFVSQDTAVKDVGSSSDEHVKN